MKLVKYRCSNFEECEYTEEEIYQDTEEVPNMFTDHFCPMCGGILRKFNFKNNPQVWSFFDERR